jgi:hypothetical protein
MKSLTDILAEAQALDTTSLDALVPGVAQIVTDLQAVIAAQTTPAVDPIATIVTTTESGATATFVPQAA